jgi:hypothetical protein
MVQTECGENIVSDAEPQKESELIHRLKNHLCIIVGFCELLLADAADAGHRRDLEEIHKAAKDAIDMMPEVASRLR